MSRAHNYVLLLHHIDAVNANMGLNLKPQLYQQVSLQLEFLRLSRPRLEHRLNFRLKQSLRLRLRQRLDVKIVRSRLLLT